MTGLIILAAGASTRLGQPKQNLLFQNKTLLQRAVESAINSECEQIFVVTGANVDLVTPTIQNNRVRVVHNNDWNEGMASSIRIAVNEIIKHDQLDSVLLMLCDQPFVDTQIINKILHKHHKTGKAIVACSYDNTVGVPVLFGKALFPELLSLRGNEGAKNILRKNLQHIVTIPFNDGGIDIDTPDDYSHLIN